MLNPETATTVVGALVAGLATSIHCVGMCGPLACLACQGKPNCSVSSLAANYHGSRLTAYALGGAVAGLIGQAIIAAIPASVLQGLPWVAGGLLVIWAIGTSFQWFPQLPRPAFLKNHRRASAILGFATPLIPCAPLYLMFGLSALSGSAVRGATLMLAFGLGTIPLLWIAQHQMAGFQRRFGQRGFVILQRTLVFSASAVILWRLSATALAGKATCCTSALLP